MHIIQLSGSLRNGEIGERVKNTKLRKWNVCL